MYQTGNLSNSSSSITTGNTTRDEETFIGDGVIKIFTITHTLNNALVAVTVIDPNGYLISPSSVRAISSSQVQIDFGSALAPANGDVYNVLIDA